MSDFWQASDSGTILNLDHVVSVDRINGPDLRITTVATTVISMRAESTDERSFLEAMARRLIPVSDRSSGPATTSGSRRWLLIALVVVGLTLMGMLALRA